MNFVKNAAAGAVLGGSLLFTAGLGMAHAQPVQAPDGLVNLSVGDVTLLESVSPDTAATVVSALCGEASTDVADLATQVDSEGTEQTVCSGLPGGDLVVAQNVSTGTAEAPAEAPAEEAPAGESAPEDGASSDSQSGSGAGLGAPGGTGSADGGSVPLPSGSDEG